MPHTPPPGQDQWQSASNTGYPSFPTTPPPGAKSGPGIGRILAIVAGVVVVAIVGLGILGAIIGDSTSAANIEVGECFAEFSQFEASVDGGENQTVDFVDAADCAEPHALEAYYVGDAYAGIDGAYSQDTIDQVAIGTCESEFETFVNHEWETSELDYWWLTPSVEGWDGGDRELICLIGDYERDLTVGTLRNAGR